MSFAKLRVLSLAMVLGLAAVFSASGLLRMTSPVLAQEQEPAEYGKSASGGLVWLTEIQAGSPLTDWPLVIETEPILLTVLDLAGNTAGAGEHSGGARCRPNHCNKETQLIIGGVEIEYQFKGWRVVDPQAGLFVLEGNGTLASGRQKARFSFTATFQDNWDGTMTIRYDASRANASFIVPNVPGTIQS